MNSTAQLQKQQPQVKHEYQQKPRDKKMALNNIAALKKAILAAMVTNNIATIIINFYHSGYCGRLVEVIPDYDGEQEIGLDQIPITYERKMPNENYQLNKQQNKTLKTKTETKTQNATKAGKQLHTDIINFNTNSKKSIDGNGYIIIDRNNPTIVLNYRQQIRTERRSIEHF